MDWENRHCNYMELRIYARFMHQGVFYTLVQPDSHVRVCEECREQLQTLLDKSEKK